MANPSVAVVGQPGDPLTDALVCQLSAQGIPVFQTAAGSLGDLQLHLEGDTFYVEGQFVGAIFFHASSDEAFSLSFQDCDRPFVDAELRALWLAAMQLDTMLAVNRYDADAWFENLQWTVWRRKLAKAGVPIAEVYYGCDDGQEEGYWLPYTFYAPQQPLTTMTKELLGAASICDASWNLHRFVCGEALSTSPPYSAQSAAHALLATGIRLVDIWVNAREQVVLANTIPQIYDPGEIEVVSERLTKLIDAHLHYR